MQLPLLIYILCPAAFIELCLHPFRSFFEISDKLLGDIVFVWGLYAIAAVLIMVWSTQYYQVSVIILIIILVTIELLSRNSEKINKRKLSDKLEYVTVNSLAS